eukprot:11264769-Heterocapsa_arctica.AAC.1
MLTTACSAGNSRAPLRAQTSAKVVLVSVSRHTHPSRLPVLPSPCPCRFRAAPPVPVALLVLSPAVPLYAMSLWGADQGSTLEDP